MGMLSSIFGAVLGQVGQQGGNAGMIANVVGGMLANDGGQGGLGGLVGKFQQAGMGDVIGSWVGSGQNMPISAEQLQNVLGSDAVAGIAQKMGLNSGDVNSVKCCQDWLTNSPPTALRQQAVLATWAT
jgi:uncharacterized protein YidB (DUF937 family)